MKTLFAILIIASSFSCVKADLTVDQVEVQHTFTAADLTGTPTAMEVLQGCPAGYAAYCAAAGQQTVSPSFSQKINFKPPTGVEASVYVDEIDITVTDSAASLGFISNLIVEISGPGIADEHFVDYTPSVPPTTELQLFPNDENVLPYIEGDNTTFVFSITGTIPDQGVLPLDITILLNGNVSFSKSL